MSEMIILVDENDQEIGYGEKLQVHRENRLHRAFSIFIADRKEKKLLLQKRALDKYHSGGLWTNACCSHPRMGETMRDALVNRLKVELGLEVPEDLRILQADDAAGFRKSGGENVIYETGSFRYFAPFDGLSEHEIDHVFVYFSGPEGFEKDAFTLNPQEVAETVWIRIGDLTDWMAEAPDDFTAWFRPAYALAEKLLKEQLQI